MKLKKTLTKPETIPSEYKWNTIPEIIYDQPKYPGATVDPIPFVEVPAGKRMPPVLFIFEYRHTGEMEVGDRGVPEEVMEQIPHKFVDLEFLQDRLKLLDPQLEDQIYFCLGMKSRKEAKKAGEAILANVFAKEDGLAKKLQQEAAERQANLAEKVKEMFEQSKTKEQAES